MLEYLESIDYVPPSIPDVDYRTTLMLLEDNDAVIKIIIKGRSPQLRHIARTHRIDVDWLNERIREDPAIKLRYVNTKQQMADILTKGSFAASQWNDLCRLIGIHQPFSSSNHPSPNFKPKIIPTTYSNSNNKRPSKKSRVRSNIYAKQLTTSNSSSNVRSCHYASRFLGSLSALRYFNPRDKPNAMSYSRWKTLACYCTFSRRCQ